MEIEKTKEFEISSFFMTEIFVRKNQTFYFEDLTDYSDFQREGHVPIIGNQFRIDYFKVDKRFHLRGFARRYIDDFVLREKYSQKVYLEKEVTRSPF